MFPADPLDDRCFTLIHTWMERCAKHSVCPAVKSVPLPKRVIEIPTDPSQPPMLRVTTNELGHYVILSHCWGKADFVKLKDSLILRYQNAIAFEELPKSFRDSIEVTRRLGFHYLWIDAMCISQDSAADWEEEAPKMTLYYGRSTLMISATWAKNASQGFLNSREKSPVSPVMGTEAEYYLSRQSKVTTSEINHSRLATRGWAAQERILAPRIIHYTPSQIIWECGEQLLCETGDKIRIHEHTYCKKRNIQPLVTQAIETSYSPSGKQSVTITHVSHIKRYKMWTECVEEYAGRQLTNPSDKLPAISGIAKIASSGENLGQYLAGLWSEFFVQGLGWRVIHKVPASPPPQKYRAPSWSWASTNAQVWFHEKNYGESYGKYAIKLVEQHMQLETSTNPYGAVKEGSYIVVESSCVIQSDTDELFEMFDPHMDRYYGEPACSCPGSLDIATELLRKEGSGNQDSICESGHFDFNMLLYWTGYEARILLVKWVDQENAVAERVGTRYADNLRGEIFHKLKWRTMRLKLV